MTKKLNIALVGYGKMGKTIEKLAIAKGHNISLKASSTHPLESLQDELKATDVAIEFTSPESALVNLELLAKNRTPTICGSTGWLNNFDKVSNQFKSVQTPFLYASNFSIGVNIFFAINRKLAQMMNHWPEYKASMVESHHVTKKDAPSGTAVSLAEDIISEHQNLNVWQLKSDSDSKDSLPITAIREADVKGMHEVQYKSEIDQIVIRHEAFSREGFASGALMAAEWIVGREGIFSMKDLLDL